jgi:hypothetical protein
MGSPPRRAFVTLPCFVFLTKAFCFSILLADLTQLIYGIVCRGLIEEVVWCCEGGTNGMRRRRAAEA